MATTIITLLNIAACYCFYRVGYSDGKIDALENFQKQIEKILEDRKNLKSK